MRGMPAGCEGMDGDTRYKGYTIRQIGTERVPASKQPPVRTYYVIDRTGNGITKAWGMTEAKALVNADIKGEL